MHCYKIYRESFESDQDVLVALRVNKSAALKVAARLNAVSRPITPAELRAGRAPVYYTVREPNQRDTDETTE